MSKLEKRLVLFAIVFVAVYIGAIVTTIQSRIYEKNRITTIESATPVGEEEGRFMLAELLLPMAVLMTLSICFIIVRKKRLKTYMKLDEPNEGVR